MIDYLIPEFFLNFDAYKKQGTRNPGGGMRTKIRSVQKASTHFQLYNRTHVSKLKSPWVLVEPMFFRLGLPGQPQGDDRDRTVDALANYPGKKILYCSEMELLRWSGKFRDKVIDACDVVAYNCEYQRRIFEALGIKDMQLLTDPIDGELFQPGPKKLQVISSGWISSAKNSEFIRDLYTALKPKNIETVYVGGNTLWGFANKENLKIEQEIRDVTDTFVDSAPQHVLAQYLANAAFFVGNTMHDTFSGCHAESMAAACISVCGGHPIYKERSLYYVKPGVDATVKGLKAWTNDFTQLPPAEYFQITRQGFEQTCSFDVFNHQLEAIIKGEITIEHDRTDD